MFELHHEQHSYPSVRRDEHGEWVPTEIWVNAEVMDYGNRFRLICFGQVPSITGLKFRFVKDNVVFEFYADRSHWGGTITGTYLVSNGFRPGQLLGSEAWPFEQERMKAIAAEINDGLRAWPAAPAEAIPIGVVHFHFWTDTSSRPRADYKFSFGEPVTLRDVPPSTRWVKGLALHHIKKRGETTFANFPSLRRDDVQLICMPTMRGPADDGPDEYHYADRDTAFDFTAERRFTRMIMTDTWEVRLDPPRREGLSPAMRARLGKARCLEIVSNIEEALYAWTPEPHEFHGPPVPVNRVVFLDADLVS